MSSTRSSSVASESTSVEATAAAYTQLHLRRARSQPLATSIEQFPTIELTREEQAHYDRVVGRLLYRAVQEYTNYNANFSQGGTSANAIDRNAWALVRSNQNMTIYKSLKAPSSPRVSLMLGIGKIDGSLEDVMDGVYSDTTEELRSVMTFLKSKFIVGTTLNVSEKRTAERPFNFAGVKWFASKTPGGAVSYDRDLLYYERQGVTFDAQGNEVAYHLMQSLDRPEWPANAFKNLIRSHSSICYLYKRKGNRVETFFWGEFYDSGRFPQMISDYAIAGKWLSVVNAVKCSEARKLSQLRENANSRSSQMSITISDMSCSEEKKLFQLDRSGRPLRDRFCKKCLADVAKQRGSRVTWNGVDVAHQPPAFFNFAFHLSNPRPDMDAETASRMSTLLTTGSAIDTSYLDGVLQMVNQESSGLEDSDWESYERRRQSHIETLSNTMYNKEKFLADLYAD